MSHPIYFKYKIFTLKRQGAGKARSDTWQYFRTRLTTLLIDAVANDSILIRNSIFDRIIRSIAHKGVIQMDMTTLVTLGVILLVVLYIISVFNKLVALKNQFQNGFSQIEVQLKRRYDLIPNLVEIAKGYMAHEKETLENVIAARNQASAGLKKAAADPNNPSALKDLAGAETVLQGSLSQLNFVMENYPDLKANQNMMQLSEELTSTENKVSFARQAFNDQVTAYNIFKQSFPAVLIAGLFGHGADATLLEFEDSAEIQAAPKISF